MNPFSNSDDPGAVRFSVRYIVEPVIFGTELDLHGSLVHRGGKPIHGIRAIVTRPFFGRRTFPARRKRNRPEVGKAYPHLPDALNSGFRVELRLGFGRNRILFQLRDNENVWGTFHSSRVFAFRFRSWRDSVLFTCVVFWLLPQKASRNKTSDVGLRCESQLARSTIATELLFPDKSATVREKTRVHLFATSKSNLFIVEIGNWSPRASAKSAATSSCLSTKFRRRTRRQTFSRSS